MAGVAADRRRDGPAAPRVHGPDRDGRRGRHVPLRRPPPVDEAGHAVHPHWARPVPRGGGRHLAARRRAGARGRRRASRSPSSRSARPGLLLVKNLGFEAPGLRDRRSPRTSRPTSPSTATARRSPARRSASTIRSSVAGYTFHQNGFGPAPDLVVRDADGQAALGRGGPADRRGGGRARSASSPSRAATSGSSCCSSRTVATAPAVADPAVSRDRARTPTGTPRSQHFLPVAPLRRRDASAPRTSAFASSLKEIGDVHAAHRQAGPGPGPRLARVREPDRRASRSRSTCRAGASGRG